METAGRPPQFTLDIGTGTSQQTSLNVPEYLGPCESMVLLAPACHGCSSQHGPPSPGEQKKTRGAAGRAPRVQGFLRAPGVALGTSIRQPRAQCDVQIWPCPLHPHQQELEPPLLLLPVGWKLQSLCLSVPSQGDPAPFYPSLCTWVSLSSLPLPTRANLPCLYLNHLS